METATVGSQPSPVHLQIPASEGRMLRRQARQHFERGEPRAAAEVLERLIGGSVTIEPAWWASLATCRADLAQWAEAAEAWRRAVDGSGHRKAWWIELGRCQLRAGDREGALETYETLVRREQHLPPTVWERLGKLRAQQGDWEGARKAWQQVLRMQGPTRAHLISLARAHLECGDVDRAEESALKALEQPTSATAAEADDDPALSVAEARVLSRVARTVVETQGAARVRAVTREVFEALGGRAVFQEWVAHEASALDLDQHMRTTPVTAGRSTLLFVRHETMPGLPTAIDVVHKISVRPMAPEAAEALVGEAAGARHHLWIPRMRAVRRHGGLTQTIQEHLDLSAHRRCRKRASVTGPDNARRFALACAEIARIGRPLDADAAARSRAQQNWSVDRLEHLVDEAERGPTCQSLLEADRALRGTLRRLRAVLPRVAEAASTLPSVFCHNDLLFRNIEFVAAAGPSWRQMVVFDWEDAGWNVLGSDLLQVIVLRHMLDLDGDGLVRRLVIEPYLEALADVVPGATATMCELGLSLGCLARGANRGPGSASVNILRQVARLEPLVDAAS